MKNIVKSVAACLGLALFSTQATAQTTQSCSEMNLVTSVTGKSGGSASGYFDFVAGDTLTVSINGAVPGPSVSAKLSGFQGCSSRSTSCTGYSETITQDASNVYVNVSTEGAEVAGAESASTITVTCEPASAATGVKKEAAVGALTAGAGTTAIGGGINSAMSSRKGGSGVAASQNGVFFATQGDAEDAQVWVSLEGRKFSGDIDGDGAELSFGADFEAGPGAYIGFVVSAGEYDLTTATDTINVKSVSYGPYFSTEIDDTWSVDGFITFADPEYDVSGTAYTAQRRSGQLRVTADYTWQNMDVASHLSFGGFREDHPAAGSNAAFDVSSTSGSLGTTVMFDAGGGLRPYVSLAAEFNRLDDGTTESEHFSPRVGLGLSYDSAKGTTTLDIDGGETLEGTRDYGLRVGHSFQF